MNRTLKIVLKISLISLLILSGISCSTGSREENRGSGKKTASDYMSDDSLMTLIQYRTFQYFGDGAEPTSGMARERYHVDGIYPDNDMNVVTSGGTGFGVMGILVGIERGFITRDEGLEHLRKIVGFLQKADRFHGAWSHWIYGETGKVKPFSQKDNGAEEYGGPLFWAHYSYLGLDPRNLKDQYADYWLQNTNHALINWKWCSENPKNYAGYSSSCWGLTASYSVNFYAAHAPGEKNDLGVISPTAALSSMPYTPDQSLDAMRHFYYNLGDKIWGKYGFYDAFSEQHNWYPQKYLAIDQGPVVVMIENYRTGLLWDLFMSCPEIENGLTNLGFSYKK